MNQSMGINGDFIRQARVEAFHTPLQNRFQFESIDVAGYWNFFIQEMSQYFPRDLFFNDQMVTQPENLEKQDYLRDNKEGIQISHHYLLKDVETNKIIAMASGYQKGFDTYYMEHAVVHPDVRGQGVYSDLIDRVILFTKRLGFNRITSIHAPYNNAVIIAKLKKDFKVTSMEVDPTFGVNVCLCYYHNKDMETAFRLRCGEIAFSNRLYESSYGTAAQMIDVMQSKKDKKDNKHD